MSLRIRASTLRPGPFQSSKTPKGLLDTLSRSAAALADDTAAATRLLKWKGASDQSLARASDVLPAGLREHSGGAASSALRHASVRRSAHTWIRVAAVIVSPSGEEHSAEGGTRRSAR